MTTPDIRTVVHAQKQAKRTENRSLLVKMSRDIYASVGKEKLMNEKRGDQTVNICGTNIAQNKYIQKRDQTKYVIG